MKNNDSRKNEKRALVASLSLAAVTAAGATFAWFTSKDEVTNRLTASADYGVSIVEDFTPPEDWLPGQEINKDVSAVNTGNIAAFVRLALLNDAKLKVSAAGKPIASFDADDEELVKLNTQASTTNTPSGGNAVNNTANEVTLLQGGGTLVIAGGRAVSPSDAWNVRSGDDGDDSATPDYSGSGQFDPAVTLTVSVPTKTYAAEYGSGVYIFQRTLHEIDGDVVKYSGYYYDADNDAFYALETQPGTVYLPDGSVTVTEDEDGVVTASVGADVKLAATKDVEIQNGSSDPVFASEWLKADGTATTAGADDAAMIRLTYVGNDDTSAEKELDDVIIDINLASDWNDNWTYISAASDKSNGVNDIGYFFYNNILEPGATTEKLVDSVTLNKDVTQEAYKELVYDLTIALDSIQITPDEENTPASYVTAVNDAGWGATAAYDGTEVSWT